jgi:anhydro-N-acetylmuramic acid kinase
MTDSRVLAGAMSGTSADGIDVAVTQITGHGLDMSAKLLYHHARPYERELRERIFTIRGSGGVPLAELAKLGRDISLAYAAAVNEALREANLKSSDVAAVCAHGQTLFHEAPNTMQWLDPALLAAETGCDVVSDFRRADCAAGGQGAPLVPFADYILFRHPMKNRVVLNIGGIANITGLPEGSPLDSVIAFDTGPGNCVSDWLCRKFDPNGPGFDEGGCRAAQPTEEDWRIAERICQNGYFQKAPPKSTDGPEMIRCFDETTARIAALDRLLAIAAATTASAIVQGFKWLNGEPDELIVSGGGVENAAIMGALKLKLSSGSVKVLRTDELGVPGVAKEALAFALLGAATLDGFPSNVPSVTGAKRAVILGSITPKSQ